MPRTKSIGLRGYRPEGKKRSFTEVCMPPPSYSSFAGFQSGLQIYDLTNRRRADLETSRDCTDIKTRIYVHHRQGEQQQQACPAHKAST
ncbi:unnamed protein product [Ectocarpus sp. 12 AP-2014]